MNLVVHSSEKCYWILGGRGENKDVWKNNWEYSESMALGLMFLGFLKTPLAPIFNGIETPFPKLCFLVF